MGRQRRAVDAAAAARPSDVSRDRLARRVRADVADVRVRLEEVVLRSDALLASGQPERAAAVLDEQHALLAELQDTIASAVAAAAVEAEAEAVLFGSPTGASVFGGDEDATTPVAEVSGHGRVRATASALASAVAALALLIVAAPTPSPSTLAAGDADDVTEEAADGRHDAGTGDARSTAAAHDADGGAAERRGIGPNEREVRRLFRSPAPQGTDGLGVPNSLSELQSLVDQFLATVVRAAGGLAPEVPSVIEDLAPRRSQPSGADAEVLRRDPADTGSDGSSRPVERPADSADSADSADATDREEAADGSEDTGDDASEDSSELPLPPEDGNASNPGVPPALE